MHPIAQIGSNWSIPVSNPVEVHVDNLLFTDSVAMNYHPRSEFLHTMVTRGFVSDCTDLQGLDESLLKGPVTGYIGFDATAASLHVGNLVQIMMLRWLQLTGNRPIILMGGGTTRVGDPSFRAEERPLLSAAQIESNIDGIRHVFSKYLDFGSTNSDAVIANNAEWLDDLNYLDFLRDFGRHFSVNRMLGFESVKTRLDREQSLSFLEFNYMILQAYDFLELNRRYSCSLQMGGSDQWGNIVNGVELSRRAESAQVFGLTTPLLTTSSGQKMGKTARGAVWLNSTMLSPFEYWQYWRNVADSDVGRFLALFTELEMSECGRLGNLRDSELNDAKIILANKATELAHGIEAAQAAALTAKEVFVGGVPSDGLPTIQFAKDDLIDGSLPIIRALVQSGLVSSGKNARRLISSGGAQLNGEQIVDVSYRIPATDLRSRIQLSSGKKRHVLLALTDG